MRYYKAQISAAQKSKIRSAAADDPLRAAPYICPECGFPMTRFPVNTAPSNQIPDKAINMITMCSQYDAPNFCEYEEIK